jgi:transposase-like protein
VKISSKTKRKYFNKSRKLEILRELQESEITLSDLARKHDIHPVTIYSWKRTLRETMKKPEEIDVAELLKEVDRLKEENLALKETVSDLAVRKRILEVSNDVYKRDQLKKKLAMQKKSSKYLAKKK